MTSAAQCVFANPDLRRLILRIRYGSLELLCDKACRLVTYLRQAVARALNGTDVFGRFCAVLGSVDLPLQSTVPSQIPAWLDRRKQLFLRRRDVLRDRLQLIVTGMEPLSQMKRVQGEPTVLLGRLYHQMHAELRDVLQGFEELRRSSAACPLFPQEFDAFIRSGRAFVIPQEHTEPSV